MQVMKDIAARSIEVIADGINLMRGIDPKLDRPLVDMTTEEMVAIADENADMIRRRDLSGLQYMALMVKELFYRGTNTHGGSVLTPATKDRMINPDPVLIETLKQAGVEITIIDSEAAFGWKVLHHKSGFLAHLTYPVR